MFDNLAVVQIFNKHSSKEKTLMKLVRRLVLATLNWNINFWSKTHTWKTLYNGWPIISFPVSGSLPTHASAKSRTNANSRNPVRTLTTQAQNLLAAALSDNTETAYKRTCGLYIQFSMYNLHSSLTYSIMQFHCKTFFTWLLSMFQP